MTKIVAILNQKGGVGKTTTAINLAAYLAGSNKRLLLIDADPQSNATGVLKPAKTALKSGLSQVLAGQKTIKQSTVQASVKNIFLVPAEYGLASTEVEMASQQGREFLLKNALASENQYDYILIDCPPALGLLTINALTAADSILIPVQAEYYALEGLSQLLQVMQQIQHSLNPELELLGLVLTMYDKRNSLSRQVLDNLKEHFSDKIFSTLIPRNVRLAEAPSHGQSIMDYDKWSKGGRAYKKLAKEFIERTNSDA